MTPTPKDPVDALMALVDKYAEAYRWNEFARSDKLRLELEASARALAAVPAEPRCDGCGKTIPEHDRLLRCPQQAGGVPAGWRDTVQRLVTGFEHVSGIARLWEPDHSSGADRAKWARATEACADVAKLLAAAPSPSAVQPTAAPAKNARAALIGEMAIDEVTDRHVVQVAGVRAVLNPTAFASDVLALVGARIVDDYEDAVQPLSEAQPKQVTALMEDARGLFLDFNDGTRVFYEVEIDHEIEDDCPIPAARDAQWQAALAEQDPDGDAVAQVFSAITGAITIKPGAGLKDGDLLYLRPAPTTPAAQERAEPVAPATERTGNPEVDRVLDRLDSSDPDFDDCADAAALIYKLEIANRGPDGFATWKDAAFHERMLRLSATPPAPAQPACKVCNGWGFTDNPRRRCTHCGESGFEPAQAEAPSDATIYCAWDEAGSPCPLPVFSNIYKTVWALATLPPTSAVQPLSEAQRVPISDACFVEMIEAAGYKTWDSRMWELKRKIEARHGVEAGIVTPKEPTP